MSRGRRGGCALLLAVFAAGCAGGSPAETPPAVVLVVIDTLRADHLGSYGYALPTSPELDRLAAESWRFDNAWSHSPWTLPAFASIVSGQPPWVHGAGRDPSGRFFPLRAEVPTMAQRLRQAGFRTGAVANVVFCGPGSGIERGFESYDHETTDDTNRGHRDAARTTDAALAFAERHRDEPFLLLVHYFDPHLTYDPPPRFRELAGAGTTEALPDGFGTAAELFAVREGKRPLDEAERRALVARYDGEIRFVDEQFGRLRAGLERLGRWGETLTIVVADHGEEFWDHGGFEHGHTHHRELLQIPLIVHGPGTSPEVRQERVRQMDLLPTVLAYAGIPDSGLPGVPLGGAGARYSVARGSLWGGDLLSVRGDNGTLLVGETSAAWFGPADFAERTPLARRSIPGNEALLEVAREVGAAFRFGERPWQPTAEQEERLRSLGYLR